MMNKAHQKGFTLVETLVAISILVLAVVGPMTIAARGLQGAFFAKEQLAATYLAQEGVEFMRMQRDQYALANRGTGNDNWAGSLPAHCKTGAGCGIDIRTMGVVECATTSGCVLRYDASAPGGVDRGMYTHSGSYGFSPYTRTILIQDMNGSSNDSDEVLVTARVSWQSGLFGGVKTVVVQSRIFNQYDAF
jgi:prepilin-type N-terminal cleavage/methylation domain-containing protein